MPDRDPTAPPSPEVDPLLGREVGGYLIETPLGEGGMGLVYRARHAFLDRRFAIKVLRPELAADLTLSSNFVREAQTLSGLKHPHLIDIVGFGPLDDRRQFMATFTAPLLGSTRAGTLTLSTTAVRCAPIPGPLPLAGN